MKTIPKMGNNTAIEDDYIILKQWAEEAEKEIEDRTIHEMDLLINKKVKEKQIEELKEVLDLMIAEIDSNPSSVRFFDLRIIKRAKELIK